MLVTVLGWSALQPQPRQRADPHPLEGPWPGLNIGPPGRGMTPEVSSVDLHFPTEFSQFQSQRRKLPLQKGTEMSVLYSAKNSSCGDRSSILSSLLSRHLTLGKSEDFRDRGSCETASLTESNFQGFYPTFWTLFSVL